MTTAYNELLHPAIIAAYLQLKDPKQSIELDIVDNGAPGIRDLHNSHFPPGDIHPDSLPVDFTFKTAKGYKFRIQMMPSIVGHDSGTIFVLGFWRHSQAHGSETFEIEAVDPANEVPTEHH
jgi:hypothetical protein